MNNRVFSSATIAALFVAVLAPLAASAADDAASLLAKHAAYVGWYAGDGVVKTVRASGEIVRNGQQTHRIRLLRYGVAFRQTFEDVRGFEDDNGFTGNVFWRTSSNGFTVRPIGEAARYLIDDHALFGELTGSYAPAVLRHETVDGVDTVVLRLTHTVALPIDVYVDPATGAYRRAVIDPGGKYEEVLNALQYTEVQGKRFISGWRYGSSKSVYSYSKVEMNPEVLPDTLRPPAQSATWSYGEGTVPVELTRETFPRIYVELTANGVKGKFILDTGAAHTIVTDTYARRVGAKPAGRTRIGGIGGSVAANLYRLETLGVGPSALHNLIVTSGLAEDTWGREGVDGLIGFDLFGGAIVELDFDAKTLRVMDPAKVAPDETKGIVVRPDLSTYHIRVPMLLNGKYDVIATLDSGNPLNVLFSADLIHKNNMPFLVDPTQLGSTRYGGGIGAGYEIERCGRLASLKLGPIEYKPVPACDSGSFARNEVLVGLDFMKAFNYVFAYPDGIVVMTPRKNI
jgi:predicted aspartyl protease